MTGHADTVRDLLDSLPHEPSAAEIEQARVALAALVRERDEARELVKVYRAVAAAGYRALASVRDEQAKTDTDPLAGLPPDLARILRDPSVIIAKDAAVFELISSWMNAPCDTASASVRDEQAGSAPATPDAREHP